MTNLSVAVITAHREIPTLKYSIASLRKWFKEKLYIYAEPAKYELSANDFIMEVHKNKKGCFKNFDYALKQLLKKENDYILVVSDDVVYYREIDKIIKDVIETNLDGVYCLFANKGNVTSNTFGWNEINQGWNNWNGLYLMNKKTAEMIVNSETYIDHLENYAANKQIDACIGLCCKVLEIPMYFHNPSLSYTIGVTSTINHKGYIDGLNFAKNYEK